LRADRVLLASGSSPRGYEWAASLGHTVVPPVPSLFTFNIDDPRLEGLAGISVPDARVHLPGTKLEQRGPLLVTHWGLSGPAVLKLSAWGARELHDRAYDAMLSIDWLPLMHPEEVADRLAAHKEADARKRVTSSHPFGLPQRLWHALVAATVAEDKRWADLSKREASSLVDELCRGSYRISGKGVFKEEFVTCGGIHVDDVDFRTMASKRCKGLYAAGEILDIDGVTGGFNFQSAWTTGWLAGRAMAAPAPD
jgi:predicted Rossmann fold flavoprotein